MGRVNDIPDFEAMFQKLKKDAVRYASRAGVNFFQDSFLNQGFTDTVLEPWAKRSNDIDPGRKILIKSAFLMNSIEVFTASEQRIEFGSRAEYAELHNEGGKVVIPITEKSRKYFWFMYRATGKEMWKGLALTKKQKLVIMMPKRQFLGESQIFMEQLNDWLLKELNKRFKAI
ncbi:phage virion morphogenesis protein [Flagellimonas eckloniae]|uniref:Uncharacterized protein n=1 Tax=Flagellimonas eckloniae TaxID=346185 RepID=A0A0Q0XMD3_9FLAO|nr:phage virion morphogenesis protein [Allomuricauda eckloniae]KQC30190.1 hypothetical protein AAY42_10110 [Allomuricauda eckloniae]